MVNEQFQRSEMLLGEGAIEKLRASKVMVFGLGGVGGYVVEILARSGVGSIVMIDSDTIDYSNINRQIIATTSVVGEQKTYVAKNRVLDINPDITIQTYQMFVNEENISDIDFSDCDYVIDAIDNLCGKITIIKKAKQENIPVISCMGTGNKLDPLRFKIDDISNTQMCPLAKRMRKILKDEGINDVKVLYSDEQIAFKSPELISSVPFVPSVAGILIGREVVLSLL